MTDSSRKPNPRMRAAAADPDESVYRKRRHESRFGKTPWCVYFYRGGRLVNGERPLTRYQYVSHHGKIKRDRLKKLIKSLALNARNTIYQNPPPIDQGHDLKWRKKSYIVVLIDDPAFRFTKGKAITVLERDFKNHTFFDGEDFDDIELPRLEGGSGTEEVTAVCFTNHMKRGAKGDDLGQEEQEFKFQFDPEPYLKIREDDGGKNLGPPVPPP